MRQGFDNDMYIASQAEHIKERIAQFGGKLYLEFGGKLFDDFHASRVLPGFEPDSKFRMLKSLADDVEIIIAINANHIEKNKARGDLGITYDEDVLRLADIFRSSGFLVGAVVLTQYSGQPAADQFRRRLNMLGITCKLHYPIEGYPHDIDLIVSEEGYGKNEFVETTRPLVVVTAPRPRFRQARHLPVPALSRAQARRCRRLCQVRDFPRVEPPAQPSRQHRLRGRHGRFGRREHHRSVPPRGARADHGQLQPRCRGVPRG